MRDAFKPNSEWERDIKKCYSISIQGNKALYNELMDQIESKNGSVHAAAIELYVRENFSDARHFINIMNKPLA